MLVQSTIDEKDRKSRLQNIQCWLLDMDGTVSIGEELLPGAERFFHALKGQRFIFLTNNSSHSAGHYVQRLNRIGIPVTRENVLTSTDALIQYLGEYFKSEKNRPVRVFPVGTPDFESELTDAGITIIKKREQSIDAVLLAFDTTLTYEKLDIACDYIRRGVPFFVANPDKVCPLAEGRVLPDCGSILAFIETCTGKKPVKIIGKPDTAMAEMVRDTYGYRPEALAMVGDRIYTDLAFAGNAGILGIAVLTGEASFQEICESKIKPEFVFDTIGDLAEYLET